MSKRESISRYNLIIKKLRKQPTTFKEIDDYLTLESEIQSYKFNVSKRTFLRDIEDIRSIYNIDIKYNFSRKVYSIELDQQPEINERIMAAFDTFNALNISDRLSEYIHFEKRRPQRTENLYELLQAIRNKLQISFTYQKYWENTLTQRVVEPYALKEFKSRWYILARDLRDNKVKSFALDRLTQFEITKKQFVFPNDFDVNEHYRHCFGIIGPNAKEPQEVVLAFSPFQGNYIKSLPLHETQQIENENENELRIKLKIFITHDFIMELLSFRENVKVIKPDSLVSSMKEAYRKALNLY